MAEGMDGADLAGWVGRSVTRKDVLGPGPVNRLAATLDRDDPPATPGDALPPLGHWLHFLPDEPLASLGPDGHPARGGFLPPVHHLPRRMWAGSRIAFHRPLRIGEEATRRSTIETVTEKQGATGPLVFVTVAHEIAGPDGSVAVTDRHDIVYRGLGGPAARPPEPAPPGVWRRDITPDPVLLFRYSALTFNGHRIHYDAPYAREVEGYPGLIVHGPLIATLLLDLLRRMEPGATIAAFAFRARSTAFAGEALALNGTPPDTAGTCRLWAANGAGGLLMEAEARIGGGA